MEKYRKIQFGKIDFYHTGRRSNSVDLEIRLKDADTDKPVFSVCGNVWNSEHTDIVCGSQCLDDIEMFFKNNQLFCEIAELWKKYHLNDLHAGTEEQEAFLEKTIDLREAVATDLKRASFSDSNYSVSCELLRRNNLYEVSLNGKPYKYGSSWLYREIPQDDLNKIIALLK